MGDLLPPSALFILQDKIIYCKNPLINYISDWRPIYVTLRVCWLELPYLPLATKMETQRANCPIKIVKSLLFAFTIGPF